MKIRRFTKRERRISGRATGRFVCRFVFPETDEQFDVRPFGNTHAIVGNIRDFISHHITSRASRLKGAKITISAEVRAQNGGLRRSVLGVWTEKDDLNELLELVKAQIKKLIFEEDRSSFEDDIQIEGGNHGE